MVYICFCDDGMLLYCATKNILDFFVEKYQVGWVILEGEGLIRCWRFRYILAVFCGCR